MKKKLTVIVLKPMHKLLHLWVCEMEKATLTWPIMKFYDFSFFVHCNRGGCGHRKHCGAGRCSEEWLCVCRPDGSLEQQEQRKLETHKSFPLPCDEQQPWGSALCVPCRAMPPSSPEEVL